MRVRLSQPHAPGTGRRDDWRGGDGKASVWEKRKKWSEGVPDPKTLWQRLYE